MFDLTLQAIGFDTSSPMDNVLVVGMHVGMPLPFAGPDQNPIVAPLGQVKFPMDKTSAVALAGRILEMAEGMPDSNPKSDLIVANSLEGVDKAVELSQRLKG